MINILGLPWRWRPTVLARKRPQGEGGTVAPTCVKEYGAPPLHLRPFLVIVVHLCTRCLVESPPGKKASGHVTYQSMCREMINTMRPRLCFCPIVLTLFQSWGTNKNLLVTSDDPRWPVWRSRINIYVCTYIHTWITNNPNTYSIHDKITGPDAYKRFGCSPIVL